MLALLLLSLLAPQEELTIEVVRAKSAELTGQVVTCRAYGVLQAEAGRDGKVKLMLMQDGHFMGAAILKPDAFSWAKANVPAGEPKKAVAMIVEGRCAGQKNTPVVYLEDARIVRLLKD